MISTTGFHKLLLVFILISSLYAQEYPTLFAQLGTPLFKQSVNFKKLSETEIFSSKKENILEYIDMQKLAIEEGLESDRSSDKKTMKTYLKTLRGLQTKYDLIENFYKHQLNTSMNENNVTTFYTLIKTPLPFIQSNRRVKKSVVSFYKQTKSEAKILLSTSQENYLKNLSKDFKLDEQSYALIDMMFEKHLANQKVKTRKSLDTFKPNENNKQVIDVVSIRTKQGFDLYLENNSYSNVTMKLETRVLVNLSSSVKLPYINSYPPRSRSLVVQLSTIDTNSKSTFQTFYSAIKGRLNPNYDENYLYALPFQRGETYKLTQGFNEKSTHKGKSAYALDFSMRIGSHVHAMRDGIVVAVESKYTEHGFSAKYASKSNYIMIEHNDGTMALYGHLDTGGVRVKVGQKIKRHQFIGLSGNTGYSSGPHLHVHITAITNFDKGSASIPFKFLAQQGKVEAPVTKNFYTAH